MKTTVIFKSRIMINVIFTLAPRPRINVPWIEQPEVGQGISCNDDESQTPGWREINYSRRIVAEPSGRGPFIGAILVDTGDALA